MKIYASTIIFGAYLCHAVSAVSIDSSIKLSADSVVDPAIDLAVDPSVDANVNSLHNIAEEALQRTLRPVATTKTNASVFPDIAHPYPAPFGKSTYIQAIPTNSWQTNLFFKSTNNLAPTTTDPYVIRVLDANGGTPGLSVSHSEEKINGTYNAFRDIPATPYGYMINPVKVDLRFTALEWKSNRPTQEVTAWDQFGATLRLSNSNNQFADFYLHQGQAFVTARYYRLTPQFYSQKEIYSIEAKKVAADTYTDKKFKITFKDDSVWIIYVYSGTITLKLQDGYNLVSDKFYNSVLQIIKLPSPECEATIDQHSSTWATGADLETFGNEPEYHITWRRSGAGKPLLIYAHPHHLSTFTRNTGKRTPLVLKSTSKGYMTAISEINRWWFKETSLPTSVSWLPSNPAPESSLSDDILQHLIADTYMDYTPPKDLETNYLAGKSLQRTAEVALVLNTANVTGLYNLKVAKDALERLKKEFTPFLENRQRDAWRYDTLYNGLVSKTGLPSGISGGSNLPAGYSSYDDHHAVHGYFIVTAAIIRYLDPLWRTNELNQWTETLIRDVNNPHISDRQFAIFRCFDWFNGHVWSNGIRSNGALDGRYQESIPEAVNFFYGLKLWGLATKDKWSSDMADLQLAILKRTTYEYSWLFTGNENRPKEMLANDVIGILYEQKVDYTSTYGKYLETIHGVQQLPMTPMLMEYFREKDFVTEEWNKRLAPVAGNAIDPWKSVLYLNYATLKPRDAYQMLRSIGLFELSQSKSYSLYLAATRPTN